MIILLLVTSLMLILDLSAAASDLLLCKVEAAVLRALAALIWI